MNIQQVRTNSYVYKNNDNKIQFKGCSPLLTSTFMAINKNEILGVSAVDLISMVIPRTVIDFSTRGKQAGIETGIRESSSTATHAAIGLSGAAASYLLAQGLKNKNYNVDFKSVVASNETIDGMAKVFQSVLNENPDATKETLSGKFLDKVFSDVKGLCGNSDLNNKNIWVALKQNSGETAKSKIINELQNQLKTNNSYKLPSKLLNNLEAQLNFEIPSTQHLSVKLADKDITTKGSDFIADAYSLAKSFTQDNVLETFKKSQTDALSNTFVKDLKKLTNNKTILGLSAICAFALSTQAINRYLTKKRTGIDGFVGDPNYNKKNNNKTKTKDSWFVPCKAAAVAAMGFFILKTINAKGLSDLAAKLQFKGNLPTVNQVKLVYGSTILGRLFAANDRNELRESCFRDFLGYTNFLVLGALVTKCFVNFKDKSLINYDAATQGKGLLNWLRNSSIKTHSEVINFGLKSDDALKPLKELEKSKSWTNDIAKKLKVLNSAKLLGMAYSCIALGIIVPLINKYMTDMKQKSQANLLIRDLPQNTKAQEIINNFLKKSTN